MSQYEICRLVFSHPLVDRYSLNGASVNEAKLGTLVELRVGGLRPGPPPGRTYMAQVGNAKRGEMVDSSSAVRVSFHHPFCEAESEIHRLTCKVCKVMEA